MIKDTLHSQKRFSVLSATIKSFAIMAGTALTMSTSQADTAKTGKGDLEIYQSASGGNINLTMMLDTSGSMGISSLVLPDNNAYGSPGDVSSPLCSPQASTSGLIEWAYNANDTRTTIQKTTNTYDATAKTHTITSSSVTNPSVNKNTFYKVVNINGTDVPYYLRGCGTPSIDATGKLVETSTGKFDRLSRLKDALIQLLVSDKIADNVAIGLGNFSSKTPILVGNSSNKLVDGHSGTMLVPVAPLTPAQRLRLIQGIAAFKSVDTFTNEDGTTNSNLASNSTSYPDIYKSSSGTPTAHAYAEAASYMMGTNTGIRSTALPERINLLYDGAAIMQKTNSTSINDQVYYICVGLGTASDANQFGATVKQCDNAWNPGEINPNNNTAYGTWYDSANQQMGSNIAIYKPNGTGGWTVVTPAQLKAQVGAMTTTWDTHAKLPVGWRYGGWMKVSNPPLDIEPINTKGWGNSGGATAYISYRSNPFSIDTDSSPTSTTSTTQGFKGCPSGTTLITTWKSLCTVNSVTASNPITRRATRAENYNQKCLEPADNSTIPMPNARKPDGTLNNNEQYNLTNTKYDSDRMMCRQSSQAVNNPWGDITTTSTTTTTTPIDNLVGGFTYSAADTKSGNNYIRGATATTSSSAQCNSNGIYFLTDGAPNSTKNEMAKTIMNRSLTPVSGTATTIYTISSTPTTGLISPAITSNLFAGETGGWEWIGEYAKRINDATKNPSGVAIKTAVAGFGSSFAGIAKNSDGSYNCDTAPNQDAINMCKWGQKGQGFGEGGFFYAQSSEDVANSITTFIASLNNTIPASPSGTVSIPQDPYRTIGELPYAFMPSLEAQVSGSNNTNNIWPGNLKKYALNDGTLYGQNNTLLFTGISGNLNKSTRDLWQNTTDYTVTNPVTNATSVDNSAVKAGGIYQNLAVPTTVPSDTSKPASRTIYVEDLTAASATTTTLRALSVTGAGVPTGFDSLIDTVAYSRANQIKLLQFLGYQSATGGSPAVTQSLDSWVDSTTAIKDLMMVTPTTPVKVLGASVHSKPVAISYSAPLNNGQVQNTGRDDYTLFGSMDGVLHLADADDFSAEDSNGGTEKLAIIPRIMMLNQPEALVPNSTYTTSATRAAGVPRFGIDGGWIASEKYTYNYTATKPNVTANSVYVYGGMRLGGVGLLGYNITPTIASDGSSTVTPDVAFKTGTDSTATGFSLIDNNVTGFSRIASIWNAPTPIKVKTSSTDTSGTDALVFGGGYDTCYEDENYQVGTTTSTLKNQFGDSCNDGTRQARGNAVYIINATTGALLWSASYDSTGGTGTGTDDSTKFDGKKYMKNSIVGGITALDSDSDGIVDTLYFADLGGQLFRTDFQNGIVGTQASDNKGRTVRLLKDDAESTSLARRFYERPNVSIHTNSADNKRFALINVISGDRSSPLSEMRKGTTATLLATNSDRLYGIIDSDVTLPKSQFFATTLPSTFPTIKDFVATTDDNIAVNTTTGVITSSNPSSKLLKLGNAITTGNTANAVAKLIGSQANYIKQGWYYPLTKFDGHDNVPYNKGMGKSEVIGKELYTTVYNPYMNYNSSNKCSAKIAGGSERQMYCLPWGVCEDSASTNGTGGFERAGQGLQELNFGPQSASQTNRRVLISNISMTDSIATANRIDWGQGNSLATVDSEGTPTSIGLVDKSGGLLTNTTGSGNLPRSVFSQRYILTPKLWYEQN